MHRKALASQVLLFDEQQVHAEPLGLLANLPGGVHVRGKRGPVHAVVVEHGLGLVDERHGLVARHELGEVGLAQLVDVVELAVGEQSRAAHAREDVAGLALLAPGPGVGVRAVLQRAAALGAVLAALDDRDAQPLGLAELVRGEEACGSCADDEDVGGEHEPTHTPDFRIRPENFQSSILSG